MEDDRALISKRLMTQEEFDQEWFLSTDAAIKGAYYTAQLAAARKDGRITRVPYDPALPVDTDWDFGIGDATAIWFNQSLRSGEVRLIDYYENSGEGLPHYVQVLRGRGYVYGQHWAPHDIRVRDFGTGKSRLETAKNHGIVYQIVPNIGLDDGVHAVRLLLPLCWFDEEKCRAGLEALTFYGKVYNDRAQAFSPPTRTPYGPRPGRSPARWGRVTTRSRRVGRESRGGCFASSRGLLDRDLLRSGRVRTGRLHRCAAVHRRGRCARRSIYPRRCVPGSTPVPTEALPWRRRRPRADRLFQDGVCTNVTTNVSSFYFVEALTDLSTAFSQPFRVG